MAAAQRESGTGNPMRASAEQLKGINETVKGILDFIKGWSLVNQTLYQVAPF
jgi:hypothetical protein